MTDQESIRRRAISRARDTWKQKLERIGAERKRVTAAILPNWDEWMEAGPTTLTFARVTQVLTGHGCFGEYLKRIGAEATAGCHHCEAQIPRSIRLQNAKHLKSSVTHLPRPSEIIYPQPRLSERYLLEQAKEKRSTHFAKK